MSDDTESNRFPSTGRARNGWPNQGLSFTEAAFSCGSQSRNPSNLRSNIYSQVDTANSFASATLPSVAQICPHHLPVMQHPAPFYFHDGR